MNSFGAIRNKIKTGIKPAKAPAEKYNKSDSLAEKGCARNTKILIANGIANNTICKRNPIAIPISNPLRKALKNVLSFPIIEINDKKASIESNIGRSKVNLANEYLTIGLKIMKKIAEAPIKNLNI